MNPTLKNIYVTKINKNRLYNIDHPVIGLTGGIATGKSSVSKILKSQGIETICADEIIKTIYKEDESISFIRSLFPSVFMDNKLNFKNLRKLLLQNHDSLKMVEDFLHPKIKNYFLEKIKNTKQQVIVYDIPLLFEKKLQGKFDITICVYCSPSNQIERIVQRDNSNSKLAKEMLKIQIPIDKKKEMADFVIENDKSMEVLNIEIYDLFKELLQEHAL